MFKDEEGTMTCNTTFGNYFVGQKINRWTLLESPNSRLHRIRCRCDCGIEKVIQSDSVLRGGSTQCRSCASRAINTKHGDTSGGRRTRLYSIWKGMLGRCYSPNDSSAKNYREKGVRVCDEWRAGFAVFRDWSLANGYRDDLTLDRWPDTAGNYAPGNCRWATRRQQNRNKRKMEYLPAFGERKLIVEWSEDPRCMVGHVTLRCRLFRGWPLERAILTPPTNVTSGSALITAPAPPT